MPTKPPTAPPQPPVRGSGDPGRSLPTEVDRAAIHAALAEVAAHPPDEVSMPGTYAPGRARTLAASEVDFTPVGGTGDTDTAALLRELSFLGLEHLPTGPSAPRPVTPRPSVVVSAKPKRKSIFSR